MTSEIMHDRLMNPRPPSDGKLFLTANDLARDEAWKMSVKANLLHDIEWLTEAFYSLRPDEIAKAVEEMIDNPKSDVIYRLMERRTDDRVGLLTSV